MRCEADDPPRGKAHLAFRSISRSTLSALFVNMQSTENEQLFDFPNKGIVGKVKGNIGDVMSS